MVGVELHRVGEAVPLAPEPGWGLVAAPGDGAAAFRAIALDHDSELVGVQRVAGSERCVGVAAVAAPGVVEQNPLLPVVHGFPGRQGLRRGAVPVAFRDGAGGSGSVSSRRRAASQSMIAMPNLPFCP